MKKLLVIIIGFIILIPNAIASTPEKCINAWSACFDQVDAELFITLDQLSKSNKDTSELIVAVPNIIRIYRRNLKLICKAAEVKKDDKKIEKDNNEEKSEKITISLDETVIKLLEVGNEEVKISELENRFGSLSDCAQITTGDNSELINLWTMCDLHANYQVELLKHTLPSIMRKSSNRKQMGFLSFKLTDLQNRLNEFIFYSLTPFQVQFQKVIDSIKCVVDKCD